MFRLRIWEKQKPRYTHNCAKCQFLGVFNEFDLYACGDTQEQDPFKTIIDTVIARRSSDGPDYSSGMEFAILSNEISHPLRQALARVIYRNHEFEVPQRIKNYAWQHIIEPMYRDSVTIEENI